MNKILNTWMSKPHTLIYYHVNSKPLFSIGEWNIYKQYEGCYLYTFKNIAVNQLSGVNKDHLKALATNTKPENDFLFNRAKKALIKGLVLLPEFNQHKEIAAKFPANEWIKPTNNRSNDFDVFADLFEWGMVERKIKEHYRGKTFIGTTQYFKHNFPKLV